MMSTPLFQETAMSTMASFEKSLASRVKEKLGDSFVRKLSYTIVTKEAIAVNDHDLPHVDPDCPCSESLCCQTSFPSVVSLDHPSAGGDGGVASGEQKPPASEDGPGMDI
jgi:hypothetical protein